MAIQLVKPIAKLERRRPRRRFSAYRLWHRRPRLRSATIGADARWALHVPHLRRSKSLWHVSQAWRPGLHNYALRASHFLPRPDGLGYI